jgi:hypothetical protein
VTGTIIVIAVVVILVLVAAVAVPAVMRRRRTQRLRGRFGPEYDRAVEQTGDRKAGEKELESREQRREQLDIRELESHEREHYSDRWRDTQKRFVDSPGAAVSEADGLVQEVMGLRGYPVGDFERRASDLSVEHGPVVDNYRSAHAIAERGQREQLSTEDERQAMVHYRELFVVLLGADHGAARQGETR